MREKNPRDSGGKTPLHLAALEGHFSICKIFIEKLDNDDIHPLDNLGRTPFQLAATDAVAKLFRVSHQKGGRHKRRRTV